MIAMDWLRNQKWLDIIGGQRLYKGMIMRGDPDSSDDVMAHLENSPLSFQDAEREAHRGTEVFDPMDAQVVTSETLANPFMHKVMIDIDHPAMLIPSTTEGHFHLMIDVDVPWEKYVDMLDAMAEAGVVEAGFTKAARKRGFSTLRMPWVKKESTPKRPDFLARQAAFNEETRRQGGAIRGMTAVPAIYDEVRHMREVGVQEPYVSEEVEQAIQAAINAPRVTAFPSHPEQQRWRQVMNELIDHNEFNVPVNRINEEGPF